MNTFPRGLSLRPLRVRAFKFVFQKLICNIWFALPLLFTFREQWGKKILLSERVLWETMHRMFPLVISLPDICQR
jgi:hypothetical protein